VRNASFWNVQAWRHGFQQAAVVFSPRDLAVFAAAAHPPRL
jgi:hypothetical protein